jgi:hypothetical protein
MQIRSSLLRTQLQYVGVKPKTLSPRQVGAKFLKSQLLSGAPDKADDDSRSHEGLELEMGRERTGCRRNEESRCLGTSFCYGNRGVSLYVLYFGLTPRVSRHRVPFRVWIKNLRDLDASLPALTSIAAVNERIIESQNRPTRSLAACLKAAWTLSARQMAMYADSLNSESREPTVIASQTNPRPMRGTVDSSTSFNHSQYGDGLHEW